MVAASTVAAGAGATAGLVWCSKKVYQNGGHEVYFPQSPLLPNYADTTTAMEGPALERRGSLKQWWDESLAHMPDTYKPRNKPQQLWSEGGQGVGGVPAGGDPNGLPVFEKPARHEEGIAEFLMDLGEL